MKFKRVLVSLLSAAMALSALAGCGSSSSSSSGSGEPAQGSIVIKYSTWANEGEAAYEGMKKFQELVEAGSNGVIKVELYPSNQAGTTNEQVEQLSLNQLQMM